MKLVQITMKVEFETDDISEESISEQLREHLEFRIEDDDLLGYAKIKILDLEDDEEESYEDED